MASDDVGQQGAVAPARVLTASAGDAPTELYALLRSVIDSTPAAIHVKDLQGRYVLVNRMAEEVLGLLASVALGRTVDDFAPPELAARAHAQDARVAHEGVTVLGHQHKPAQG